jgi:hypothetical protein
MKLSIVFLACITMVSAQPSPAPAAPPDQTTPAPPMTAKIDPNAAAVDDKKPKTETLRFTVNWPSGLSLGEGVMTSSFDGTIWNLSFSVEAALPGFGVIESAESKATAEFCSIELKKKLQRGSRKSEEETTFDPSTRIATRQTVNGGKSEMNIGSCVRDALTFVRFLRRELSAGRLPPAQPVYYGAPYQTQVQYTGTQSIRTADEMVEADKLTATIKGPSAKVTVDLFFARDEARTPVFVQIPLAMGSFTVEFSR